MTSTSPFPFKKPAAQKKSPPQARAPMAPTKLPWYEKTVEYMFIADAISRGGLTFAIPFAGAEEAAGDAIFAAGAKMVLIEFKRDVHQLGSERGKYPNFEQTRKGLPGSDQHHLFVYGNQAGVALELIAQTYFTRRPVTARDVLGEGIEEPAFRTYLDYLLRAKKPDGRSGGSIGPEALDVVFGVVGNRCQTMRLSEYVASSRLDLQAQAMPPADPAAHGAPDGQPEADHEAEMEMGDTPRPAPRRRQP